MFWQLAVVVVVFVVVVVVVGIVDVPQVGSSMGLWLGLGVAQTLTVAANFLFSNKRMCCSQ